jgi:3-hydroxyisobutyrate dehydrogenase-like beta-hydroxyacid dehydrogenase
MAGCLVRDGYSVTVLGNSNRAPVDHLTALGATEAAGCLELVAASDTIILCLPNSAVVEKVISAMKPVLDPGRHTIVDTGTSSLASTAELARELSAMGIGFAEAPLTGGKLQAHEGVLGALVGTDLEVFAEIEPVLGAFCATVQRFGPVGAGGRAKLINNAMVIGIAALVIEAFRKARRTHTDWGQLYDVVTRGSADSGVLRRIVGTALDGGGGVGGRYRGYAFTVANAYKDMQYVVQMDELLGFADSGLNAAVLEVFRGAVEEGMGGLLISELLELEPAARWATSTAAGSSGSSV